MWVDKLTEVSRVNGHFELEGFSEVSVYFDQIWSVNARGVSVPHSIKSLLEQVHRAVFNPKLGLLLKHLLLAVKVGEPVLQFLLGNALFCSDIELISESSAQRHDCSNKIIVSGIKVLFLVLCLQAVGAVD
jgi:hypothetical protein